MDRRKALCEKHFCVATLPVLAVVTVAIGSDRRAFFCVPTRQSERDGIRLGCRHCCQQILESLQATDLPYDFQQLTQLHKAADGLDRLGNLPDLLQSDRVARLCRTLCCWRGGFRSLRTRLLPAPLEFTLDVGGMGRRNGYALLGQGVGDFGSLGFGMGFEILGYGLGLVDVGFLRHELFPLNMEPLEG